MDYGPPCAFVAAVAILAGIAQWTGTAPPPEEVYVPPAEPIAAAADPYDCTWSPYNTVPLDEGVPVAEAEPVLILTVYHPPAY